MVRLSPAAYQTLRTMAEELHRGNVLLRPYRREDAAVLQEAIAESRDQLRP